MNLIVLGTDHTFQYCDESLKELIAKLIESELVALIGEESTPNSIANQVADSKGIKWIPVDMTERERNDAGIGNLSLRRMRYRACRHLPDDVAIYAPKEDGVREAYWLTQLENEKAGGTVLLVCGAVHVRPLSEKAQNLGHQVTPLFFPDSLSELQVSKLPEPS
jgi:hypothetical protein